VTSGNTNAPAIMIGEKVSAMIKQERGVTASLNATAIGEG
jgi:choline dehydrogenase-like flavoprotein